MRKITIRQFQRNFYKEIKDLPILIVKRGKKFFVVKPVKVKPAEPVPNNPEINPIAPV